MDLRPRNSLDGMRFGDIKEGVRTALKMSYEQNEWLSAGMSRNAVVAARFRIPSDWASKDVRGLSPKAVCKMRCLVRDSLCVSFDYDSLSESMGRKKIKKVEDLNEQKNIFAERYKVNPTVVEL